MASETIDWGRFISALGYSPEALLGRGMEGTVYRLGGDLVGKVWFHRTGAELESLRVFYEELAAQHLPFATPRIVEVHSQDGAAVSIERELPGHLLKTAITERKVPADTGLESVIEIVTALRNTQAGPATRAMRVLGENTGLWSGHDSWGRALAALVQRRATSFHDSLSAAIPNFPTIAQRVSSLLHQLPQGAANQVVHGDICQENILIDTAGRVTSVLDWGFVTTAGDNAFDASTAAGFYDMYGPHARDIDDTLLDRLEQHLGYPRDLLLLYRAAYAIAGANAYSADGSDGHFTWCVATLDRHDIKAMLSNPCPELGLGR